MERRKFLKTAGLGAAAVGLASAGCKPAVSSKDAPAIHTKIYEWKMVTSWMPHFPILGEGADKFAADVSTMTGGKLKIKVFGGGELVPALESFDAVSMGVAEMGHAAAYYWAGKAPAAQFFTSLPFGMNTRQTYTWLYEGGGLDLWRELYSHFNMIPFPCGNTGAQTGGWYNREIKTVNDLKGLKIRMPGIGGKVIGEAGATAILSPGGEIYTNLERGVIDATEWIGPYHDYLMGFHKIAKYYYYPGWHEPTGVLELFVNKTAYESLPEEIQKIIAVAADAANLNILAMFEAKNSEYLTKMKSEGVDIRKFPEDVLIILRQLSEKVISKIAATDAFSARVLDSYNLFRKNSVEWEKTQEG